MKHFLATTAIAALLALPATAQTLGGNVGAGVGVTAGTDGAQADVGVTAGTTAQTDGMATGTEVTGDWPMDGAAYLATGIEASALTGTRVYDANDEWIGEINDVVVETGGETWAIIDVGGFLGIGEKPVALALADLQISQETVVDGEVVTETAPGTAPTAPTASGDAVVDADADIKISVALTKEQLEAMPEYEG